jgi:hypothetical protein
MILDVRRSFKDRLMAPPRDFPRRESRRAIETLRPARTPASSAVPNLRIHLPPAASLRTLGSSAADAALDFRQFAPECARLESGGILVNRF